MVVLGTKRKGALPHSKDRALQTRDSEDRDCRDGDAEALFREARRLERRRRARLVEAGACAAALVAGILTAIFGLGSSTGRSANTTGRTPGAVVPSSPPDVIVIHGFTATAHPGAIQVVDTSTGKAVKTLGHSYEETGFQLSPDARTLYYETLDTAQHVESVVAMPLDGGRPRGIAHAGGFALSANGTLMALTPTTASGGNAPSPSTIRILDLATHTVVATARLPVDHTGIAGLSWVAGTEALFVVTGSGGTPCSWAIIDKCSGGAPKAEDAYLGRLQGHQVRWSKLQATSSLPDGPFAWTGVQPFAPGPGASTVIATASAGSLGWEVLVLDARTGRVLHTYLPPQLPGGDVSVDVRGVDASGRHFLLASTTPGGVQTQTWEWTLGSRHLRLVGPPELQATW